MAGILGYMLQQRLVAQNKAGDYKRPQSITQKTEKTPIQVVQSSIVSWLSCVFWTVVLVITIAIFICRKTIK